MKAVDLFCGAGGAARGMHAAGFDVLHGVDKNRAALRAYNESLPGEPIQHDLRIVRPGVLPPLAYDLVHGSWPCQGFSQAKGERDPDDPRNKLFWRFVEWVDRLRPKVVTGENVPGMATISNTFMDRVMGAFREIGYDARWKELNAANYGVPQTRRRIFVVGVREDLPTPSRWFPQPTHAKGGTTTLDGRTLEPWRTVHDAIGDLHYATDGGVMTSQQNEGHQAAGRRDLHSTDAPAKTIRGGTPPLVIPNHDVVDHSDEAREWMADQERGKSGESLACFRVHPDEPAPTLATSDTPIHYAPLPNHEPVTPSDEAREKMAAYAPGSTHNSVTERRLAGDEPAKTVAANHTQMIVGEDIVEQVRRLTVREAARLQSFPDDHLFVGTKTEQLQQVGNAVPPRLMYHLARHVRRFIEDAEVRTDGE